jgi:hypothetical protein
MLRIGLGGGHLGANRAIGGLAAVEAKERETKKSPESRARSRERDRCGQGERAERRGWVGGQPCSGLADPMEDEWSDGAIGLCFSWASVG